MSPAPIRDPIPRFVADASREALPYGRWAEQLRAELAKACEPLKGEAGAELPEEIVWYPERGWGGRVYIPATAVTDPADGDRIEWFGYVSFVRPEQGDPTDFKAVADFTDILAEENPEWQVDLNEEVIGKWLGEAAREGDVTLVWGRPLIRGAHAATAELGGEVVDQTPVPADQFTLIALDAVKGFGDDLFLEVRVWSKRGVELAAESLYDEPEEASGAEAPPPGPDSSAG